MEFPGQVASKIRHEAVKNIPKMFRIISTFLLFHTLPNFIPRIHNSKIADQKQVTVIFLSVSPEMGKRK